MKSCCGSTSNDISCKRKDGKTFSLPRKFGKSKCKNPKGFTMKSSCAPYKYCSNRSNKHSKKGGNHSNKRSSKSSNKRSKKNTKKRVLLPKLRPINNKNVKHKYKLSDSQNKRILAIDEGIRDEAKKTGKTLKKAAISKKGRFNILRIYRKNKQPQECKRITSDMKYIDKKYGLGKTTNICKDNKTGGTIENKRSNSEENIEKTTKKQRLFDPTAESRNQWPSFKGPGEILEITNLISCIAVIVKKYEDGKLVGVVGGHFITSEAFSVVDNMLTDEGKYFMEDIFNLLDEHEMTPDNTTTMLVIRPTGTRKPHPETKKALKILKPMFENKSYNVDIKITPEDKNVSKLISVYSNKVIVKVPE